MKQINLHNINLSRVFRISTLILLIIIYFQNCTGSELEVVKVKIPEQKGQFKTDIIKEQVTIYVPKPFKDRTKESKLLNDISELNTQLELYKEELDNAIDEFTYKDSINKLKAYADAIALREFNQPFEDEFIKIENSGYTFGTLKSLKTSYTIKEREVEVNIPKNRFKLSAGAFAGNNTNLSQWIYGGNLTVNKSSVNYIRIGSVNYFTIGKNFDIIK